MGIGIADRTRFETGVENEAGPAVGERADSWDIQIPALVATADNIEPCGLIVGEAIGTNRLGIPFYGGHVEEGRNLPFEYRGKATFRTARIHPRALRTEWLERHRHLTQLFVGLSTASFAMVLGSPTADSESGEPILPEPATLRCFVFGPGTGVLLHKGTWHDFPMAIDRPVTCLTANSAEVVEALSQLECAREMNEGDVQKVRLLDRLGFNLTTRLA